MGGGALNKVLDIYMHIYYFECVSIRRVNHLIDADSVFNRVGGARGFLLVKPYAWLCASRSY